MNQKLSGPVMMIILVVVIGAIGYFGYTKFLAGPPEVSPEETQRMMGGGGRPGAGDAKPN